MLRDYFIDRRIHLEIVVESFHLSNNGILIYRLANRQKSAEKSGKEEERECDIIK